MLIQRRPDDDRAPLLTSPQPMCGWAEPTETAGWTAAMLARLPDDGWQYELVQGRVVRMPPTGLDHGGYESRIDRRLGTYVEEHGLGEVYVGKPGFDLTHPDEAEDTVLAADIAFISAARLPAPPPRPGKSFTPLAPDLVVEIASPSQYRPDMGAKARLWLERGVRLDWIVWPGREVVDVWTPGDAAPRTLGGDAEIDGGAVVPGFRLSVRDLWLRHGQGP